MKSKYLAPSAMIAAVALAGAAFAAERPKEVSFAGKSTTTGKFLQGVPIGKNEAFVAIFDENGTASGNGPDHKLHCLGVLQGLKGVVETHAYCIMPTRTGIRCCGRRRRPPTRWTRRACR